MACHWESMPSLHILPQYVPIGGPRAALPGMGHGSWQGESRRPRQSCRWSLQNLPQGEGLPKCPPLPIASDSKLAGSMISRGRRTLQPTQSLDQPLAAPAGRITPSTSRKITLRGPQILRNNWHELVGKGSSNIHQLKECMFRLLQIT